MPGISSHDHPIRAVLDMAVMVCSYDPGTLESGAGGLLPVGKQLRLHGEFIQGYYIQGDLLRRKRRGRRRGEGRG